MHLAPRSSVLYCIVTLFTCTQLQNSRLVARAFSTLRCTGILCFACSIVFMSLVLFSVVEWLLVQQRLTCFSSPLMGYRLIQLPRTLSAHLNRRCLRVSVHLAALDQLSSLANEAPSLMQAFFIWSLQARWWWNGSFRGGNHDRLKNHRFRDVVMLHVLNHSVAYQNRRNDL